MISLPSIITVPLDGDKKSYCVSNAGNSFSFSSTEDIDEAHILLIRAYDRAIEKLNQDLRDLMENHPHKGKQQWT